MDDKNNKNKPKTAIQMFGRVSGLGITFVATVCITAYIGYKADIFFSTKPILTCIGTILGFIAALISVYKIIKKDVL